MLGARQRRPDRLTAGRDPARRRRGRLVRLRGEVHARRDGADRPGRDQRLRPGAGALAGRRGVRSIRVCAGSRGSTSSSMARTCSSTSSTRSPGSPRRACSGHCSRRPGSRTRRCLTGSWGWRWSGMSGSGVTGTDGWGWCCAARTPVGVRGRLIGPGRERRHRGGGDGVWCGASPGGWCAAGAPEAARGVFRQTGAVTGVWARNARVSGSFSPRSIRPGRFGE